MKLEADLIDLIEAICLQFPRYGYRRVSQQLKREGWVVNHKKVLRLMQESDLLCRVKRRWVKTTNSNHYFPAYPNLIKDMAINRLNQVWIADITYIRIQTGFVYLAAILDAYSRRAIGYTISASQGVQYASKKYVEELKNHGFEISMSRKGNPYDNATMESFFKTLKYKEMYLCEYKTLADVMNRLI